MRDDSAEGKVPNAADEVARLGALVDAMRAELSRLQLDLVAAHRDADGSHGARLLEANTQLVKAALLAQAEAADALVRIDELVQSSDDDPLTGLPNRFRLLDRTGHAIVMARRHRKSVAVLFFNVDSLEGAGHAPGEPAADSGLQRVARGLEGMVHECDMVCRYGRDEFAVLLSEVADPAEATATVARIVGAMVRTEAAVELDDRVSLSAGVAVFPQDGEEAAVLISRATAAMRTAKGAGTGFALHQAGSAGAAGQSPPVQGARPAAPADAVDLREANTQLLVAALEAQAHEAEARQNHRQQIQYMAMVAHELRNPLVPIRLAASLLQQQGTDKAPSLPRLRAIIERQVVQISRLVEDLLEGSRISAGKLRLEMSSVDLVEILEHAVLSCRPGTEARSQSIDLDCGPGPLLLRGDAVRLVQVFCNLLDNASKYTQAGGAIRVSARRSGDTVEVSVSDNGAGISPAALTKIFDLFVQDDHDMSFDKRGLGIGLAVVRELVGSHGGSVTARSEGKGKGSEFVVILPIDC